MRHPNLNYAVHFRKHRPRQPLFYCRFLQRVTSVQLSWLVYHSPSCLLHSRSLRRQSASLPPPPLHRFRNPEYEITSIITPSTCSGGNRRGTVSPIADLPPLLLVTAVSLHFLNLPTRSTSHTAHFASVHPVTVVSPHPDGWAWPSGSWLPIGSVSAIFT